MDLGLLYINQSISLTVYQQGSQVMNDLSGQEDTFNAHQAAHKLSGFPNLCLHDYPLEASGRERRAKYGKVSRVQFAHRGGEAWTRPPGLRMSCCNLGDVEGPGLAFLWREACQASCAVVG